MADILFVTPPIAVTDGPEIGLLYIASYIERETGFSLRIVDMNVEKLRETDRIMAVDSPRMNYEELRDIIIKERPGIIAVGGATYYVNNSLKVLALAKEVDEHITTVIGGAHATAVKHEIIEKYPYVDFVIYGEGENTFLEVAQRVLTFCGSGQPTDGTIVRKNGRSLVNRPRKLWGALPVC